jgi:cobalt-zinc-cadmium efflux system membrane fusion protein
MRISTAPGAVLDEGQEIAVIADPTRTELVFEAPPASAAGISVRSHIEGRGASGVVIEGEVTGVAPAIAGDGATVRARVIGAAPPPGTVISGRIAGGGAGDVLTVPSEAVQTVEGRPVVFIAEAEGFRARAVTPGRVSGNRTEIVSGLEGHEQIAGAGAFLLKAELGKGEAEHEH